LAVEIVVASEVEIEATRGVSYYEEFSLYANDGTAGAPIQGDGLDLSDWPGLVLMADVIADQQIVRGTTAYIFTAPVARISVAIPYAELDRAFDSSNNSRPMHVTVKAGNTAGTIERVLLNGVLRVSESGY
jgi:hypothetical protein